MEQDALTVVVSGPLSHVGQVREGLRHRGLRVDDRTDSRGFDTEPTEGWVTAHRTITVEDWADPDGERDGSDLALVQQMVGPLGWALRMHWNPSPPAQRLVVSSENDMARLIARMEALEERVG